MINFHIEIQYLSFVNQLNGFLLCSKLYFKASASGENCLSLPTSPASLSTPIIEADVVYRRSQQSNPPIRKCDVSGFRTSRSEDHLQHTQRDIMDAIVPIDVDDVNSSLNTLLDTRDDSEGTQV